MRYISEDDKETKKKGTRRRKRNRKILLVGLEKRLVKLSQKQKQELIDVNEHDFEGRQVITMGPGAIRQSNSPCQQP